MSGGDRPADPVYEALAAFFAELAGAGVHDVVISPGSRSTPLALSAWWRDDLRCRVVLDERVAAFSALGTARASRRPVALVCTSGTAAANYLPAVVEANHGGVPLVVVTADRPPELREWGAGQTVDQVHMYGRNVRWFAETPVPGDAPVSQLRRLAARAVAAAVDQPPGPVHLNVPLREPLEPRDPPVPPAEAELRPVASASRPGTDLVDALAALVREHERGLVLAGPCDLAGPGAAAVVDLAARAGWPVLADPLSQLRRGPHVAAGHVLATGVHLLDSPEFADRHVPDVVLRLGSTPTSKPARLWLERHRPRRVVLVTPPRRWDEPSFTATDVLQADPGELCRAVLRELGEGPPLRRRGAWLDGWLGAEAVAGEVVEQELGNAPLLAPLVARTLGRVLPAGAVLVASSSMPVRDVDAFLPTDAAPLRILANRGANGIDGVTSTAWGAALAGAGPTVALLGDLAVLHDVGGLVAAAGSATPLVLVVVDDAGGGIFAHLPIAALGSAVAYDDLFRTPQPASLRSVAALAGVRYERIEDVEALERGVTAGLEREGVSFLHVPVDPDANLAQHRAVREAVRAALDGAA